MAAGLLKSGESAGAARINELYEQIEARVIDLSTGEYADVSPSDFDSRRAALDPSQSEVISPDKDLAGIKRRAKLSDVYMVSDGNRIRKVILPINGKGLWSTLYGFIALDSDDVTTIRSLLYYEHGETPGLGGEVDNPAWKALWNGKQAFADDGSVAIQVIRGTVDATSPSAEHQVDGISGATITARGVQEMLHYWLGDGGYGPFLDRLRAQTTGDA